MNIPPSQRPEFRHMVARRLRRRTLLKGGLGAGFCWFLGGSMVSCTRSSPDRFNAAPAVAQDAKLGFASVAGNRRDEVTVPEGYRVQVFAPWGSPLNGVEPAFDPANGSAQQLQQKGSHHDGMHFFPIDVPQGGESSEEGLLVTNHEYIDPNILHPGGPTVGDSRPSDEVRKEMAAHGVSIQHIRRDAKGHWSAVADSQYHRRITAMTPMELQGPARSYHKCRTAYSREGKATRGTLNNCSMGVTPWHTYLAAEENWADYFINTGQQPREHRRYSVASQASRYGWELAEAGTDLYGRFNATPSADRAEDDFRWEPNTFGWIVEIDPFDPLSLPQKRTALGRFAHEGVVFAPAQEGQPLVCYSGDDAKGEYIYKFVSAQPYHQASAGGHLLDEGTLYVARFNDDGTGVWLALDWQDKALQRAAAAAGVVFENQADVLVNTRLAADVLGATAMDRPEWGAVHPGNGQVYFTLTNNSERTPEEVNAANPRPFNALGHIVRWREQGDDHAAVEFQWDIFVLAGPEGTHTSADSERPLSAPAIKLEENNQFACPDGLWFDRRGVLWIQTDMSGSLRGEGPFGNNQMLAADTDTGDIRRFLVGPKECEVTGVVSTPDLKNLFVNIQHPGEYSEPNAFTSHWPDGGNNRPRSATLVITRKDGGVVGS